MQIRGVTYMEQVKNTLPGNFNAIAAQLVAPTQIELTVSKHYYDGEASDVLLRQQETLTPLTTVGKEEIGAYVIHQVTLPYAIDYTQPHEVLVNNGLSTPLNVDWATQFDDFDTRFTYTGDDLGNTYTPEETVFKVWAPLATKVKVDVQKNGIETTYTMAKGEKGVWSCRVAGDLEGYAYVYLLQISGEWREATDPYAYTSTANSKESVIIDLAKLEQDLGREMLPALDKTNDAIIYEVHVRDFSVSEASGITQKGKFLGVVEPGTTTPTGASTGYDYLAELGVTHVQFLPVYDFGSVDENNPFAYYNWGYDPMQYNVPEGSYATDVKDPYKRVQELQQMNKKLHERGLRSIMDVVYNHMFAMEVTAFQKIVPNYYFRFDEARNRSNGSYCSNDLDSTREMCRRYIIASCMRWMRIYGFDGFRFDLMGILDQDTMNALRKEMDTLDKTSMLYGEGWHMPTTLDASLQATMSQAHKMPRIGHFNDAFRENIKEVLTSEGLSHQEKTRKLMSAMQGNTTDVAGETTLFNDVCQSLNYVECHDNATFEDYMRYEKQLEGDAKRYQNSRMAMTLVLTAQGIPFVHAGQEFRRTKQGVENSYKSPDTINQLDWTRRDTYQSFVTFTKGLIALRKAYPHFKLETPEQIKASINFEMADNGVLIQKITCQGTTLVLYINAQHEAQQLQEGGVLLVDSNKSFVDSYATEGVEEQVIAPFTVMLFKQ